MVRPATVNSFVEMILLTASAVEAVLAVWAGVRAAFPGRFASSRSLSRCNTASPANNTTIKRTPARESHRIFLPTWEVSDPERSGAAASGTVNSVCWPQCGQATDNPAAAAGNSMCPAHWAQAHLKYFVSLMALFVLSFPTNPTLNARVG